MNEWITRAVGLVIGVGHLGAWWFAIWFPFRRRRFASIVAIPIALAVSFYASMLIIDTTRAVEFAVALPFAIAGINYISYRDRKEDRTSEPTSPGDVANRAAPEK